MLMACSSSTMFSYFSIDSIIDTLGDLTEHRFGDAIIDSAECCMNTVHGFTDKTRLPLCSGVHIMVPMVEQTLP